MFLLCLFKGAQPALPGAFQAASNQTVFRFDRIILATRALNLVTQPFQMQFTLSPQGSKLVGEFIQGGQR
jgi:hypothetical protein